MNFQNSLYKSALNFQSHRHCQFESLLGPVKTVLLNSCALVFLATRFCLHQLLTEVQKMLQHLIFLGCETKSNDKNLVFSRHTSALLIAFILHTANMCREITVKVHLKNCNFEKLQFFTVDHSSLCFLPVKNCNFSIIFNVVYFALN